MTKLVQRWGRTKFAAITSLVWALPLAAWAGSVDLYPGPGPWAAFGLGMMLLGLWLVVLTRLRTIEVEARPHRLDFSAMSATERRWNAAFALSAVCIIGWLNGAATVDWSILAPSLRAGRAGAVGLAVGLAAFLLLAVAGAVFSGIKSQAAWRRRSVSPGAG
jgi:hypothetical protein